MGVDVSLIDAFDLNRKLYILSININLVKFYWI